MCQQLTEMLDSAERPNTVPTRPDQTRPGVAVSTVHKYRHKSQFYSLDRIKVTSVYKMPHIPQNSLLPTNLLLKMTVKVALTPHLFRTNGSQCDSITCQYSRFAAGPVHAA